MHQRGSELAVKSNQRVVLIELVVLRCVCASHNVHVREKYINVASHVGVLSFIQRFCGWRDEEVKCTVQLQRGGAPERENTVITLVKGNIVLLDVVVFHIGQIKNPDFD